MSQTRRSFLKKTLAAAATVTIAGTKSSGRVLGANDTLRVGVAGLNGRGGSHVGAFSGMDGVQITYLIDPDERTYDKHLNTITKRNGGTKPQCIKDVRKALDDKNLDIITIATPNHWHALMTIWACQAGKDVYVEKPCSHNLFEGRKAVEAARKYKRIVQHGTQSRSSQNHAHIMELIRSGKYGKLLVSRGLCYKPRGTIGFKPNATPPEEVDFNIWLGPAAERPFHTNLVHYNWHWFWDFGNGDIGNQGVHEMDKARWGIPGATLPKSVISIGGRFGYKDQGETPNTQIAVFDYGETQLIFEVRGLKTKPYPGEKGGVGNTYHLEGGTIAGGKFYPKGKDAAVDLLQVPVKLGPGKRGDHFNNFIEAVRTRRKEDLNADILEGHLSSALCHLANMSYRLGKDETYNGDSRAFGDNKEAAETVARMAEHLKDNSVPLDGLRYRVGRKLTVDATQETIVGDAEAKRLLTRQYRKPFIVPEKV